jgi:hypothetical protein
MICPMQNTSQVRTSDMPQRGEDQPQQASQYALCSNLPVMHYACCRRAASLLKAKVLDPWFARAPVEDIQIVVEQLLKVCSNLIALVMLPPRHHDSLDSEVSNSSRVLQSLIARRPDTCEETRGHVLTHDVLQRTGHRTERIWQRGRPRHCIQLRHQGSRAKHSLQGWTMLQSKKSHKPTDTQTHRHTDTQTHRHTDTDTQTHRHPDTQTHRHTDTQTHRHTDSQTHRHTQDACEIMEIKMAILK